MRAKEGEMTEMDKVRLKAQSLLDKLQGKYGVAPKSPGPPGVVPAPPEVDCQPPRSPTSQVEDISPETPPHQEGGDDSGGGGVEQLPVDWYLVDAHNKRCHLPKTMLFLGRDECDIIIQSGSVDKRHAVITFDLYLNRFKVKDLSTTNGTYVNESRIPEQEYVTLNHMDSIRLGYDSKVYHMEQGLPTNDSPPPPPLPAIPPPPLNLELEETELPEPPAWVTRHSEPPMAECQGCIAEQKIEHTCTHASHHPAAKDHSHPHHANVQHSCQDHNDANLAEPTVEPEPEPEQQAPKLGRNTWPRKKVRQVAHVAYIFDADDDSADGGGSGCGSDALVVESGSNYFVSLDDTSVCDSRGRSAEYPGMFTSNVQRIPRNSKFPALPPELETVKKGTPLYGQPAWWGEDADTTAGDTGGVTMDKQSGDHGLSRPGSLSVSQDDHYPHTNTHHHGDARQRPVPMEIPHGSTTPERDKRDKVTPARSITSSLSKDSLVLSPDSTREKSVGKDSAGSGESSSNPSLSFTVEFGDEKKPRLNMAGSLSEFVPPKIRHSLASHNRVDKPTPPKGPAKELKGSSSSGKNSEERELSPGRQKRLDELFGAEGGKVKSKRQSSGQATGIASLKTADFSSEPSLADRGKDGRREAERRSKEAERDAEKKAQKPPDGRKSSPRATTTSKPAGKSKPTTAATIAASVHQAQYADPTAYLIDKMFAGATASSMDSPRSISSDRSDSPVATEHTMYKEAAEHDKSVQRGGLTYRAQDKQPAVKQKSTSRSPASKPPKSPEKPQAQAVSSPETSPGRRSNEGVEVSSVPVTLPVAPSPVGDQEDKVSEAGTYTIEADKDDAEEMAARQQIDEVFGVEVENFSFERLVIGSREQLAAPDEEEADRTLHEDDDEKGGCRTPCDENGMEVFDIEDEEDDTMSGSNGVVEEDTIPAWVSQLSALTAGHKATTTTTASASKTHNSMASKAEGETPKKSSGLSRKRPGTGRKLPSIPGMNDNSPVSSEHSSCVNDSVLDTAAGVAGTNGFANSRLENGHSGGSGGADLQSKGVTFSPVLSGAVNGVSGRTRLRTQDSPLGSEDSSRESGRGLRNGSSARSQGSIDTEILLRDTETVMAAMEARMGFRTEKGGRGDDDNGSDTDLSSMVAMVNGDDDYVKPTKFHSPRESLSRKSSKDKDNSNIKLASRKPLLRSQSEHKPPFHGERSTTGSTRSGAGVSVVSDVLSRNESLDESFQSDVSSDRGSASFSRSGSGGKGTITMTKPNRAFALRRARADGSEVTEAPQNRRSSAASTASSQASSRRSSSVHSTGRMSYSERPSGRSEASLGAQIAKKARDNAASGSSRNSPMTRVDGRRNSLKGVGGRTTTPSSTASSSLSTTASAKKDRDLRTLKSQLKTAPVNRDLAITGVSSRSHSQPGSRSNSPKAAERMAWKRRKEYDPRRAVIEAKAKPKDPKPKPKAHSSLFKQRMIRSASFTNTNSVDLTGRVRHDTYSVDSTSSVEDLSSAATPNDSHTEAGFRRAFIPFHNPLRGDRLSHSADEDEAGTFPTSQDVLSSVSNKSYYQHPVSLSISKSAFTPPLSKLHTPSPDSPPPLGASLLLRRRTLGAVECDDAGASTAGASSHLTQAVSPQSYDTLIVSSIYQLSLKLKTNTDKTINKLREQDRVSITPSPIDDFLGHPAKSEIPAWKSANQELAGVLKNLRKMEHHLHVMERALFPDEDTDLDVSGMSNREKHKYFQEIERIRSELAGFQPIDTPRMDSQDPGSPEMAELSQDFC